LYRLGNKRMNNRFLLLVRMEVNNRNKIEINNRSKIEVNNKNL